jgi:hypothetical protein
MENNIGVIKALLFNNLRDNYVSDVDLNESTQKSADFFKVIKESSLLQLQLTTYNKLEKKHISEDAIATRYIDNNLSQFSKYSQSEIIAENKKLETFNVDSTKLDVDKKNLYEAINNLIVQSAVAQNDSIDVDQIHESFITVLNHIKNNKPVKLAESKVNEKLLEHFNINDVVDLAIKKFNDKFSHLDEGERDVLKVLTMGTLDDKKEIFESLKEENLTILEGLEKNGIHDKINETVAKINNMTLDESVMIKNITGLYDLKKKLTLSTE